MKVLYYKFVEWLNAEDDYYGDMGYGMLVSLMRYALMITIVIIAIIVILRITVPNLFNI